MDLNIVVLAGKLVQHPAMEYDLNRRATLVELKVNTTGAPRGTLHIVTVRWTASDDELASVCLLRGDRVWISGYLTGSSVQAIHVQKAGMVVQR